MAFPAKEYQIVRIECDASVVYVVRSQMYLVMKLFSKDMFTFFIAYLAQSPFVSRHMLDVLFPALLPFLRVVECSAEISSHLICLPFMKCSTSYAAFYKY